MAFSRESDLLRGSELSFYEELQLMPYKSRCIVLGIVMGVYPKEIRETLKINKKEYCDYVAREKLERWHFFRALLDN